MCSPRAVVAAGGYLIGDGEEKEREKGERNGVEKCSPSD